VGRRLQAWRVTRGCRQAWRLMTWRIGHVTACVPREWLRSVIAWCAAR
jgi:hypothetical protein